VFLSGFFWGAAVGSLVTQLIIYMAVRRHRTKVGTPSASHNSVRNAIAQVRESARRTLCKPPKYNEFVAYLDWLEQQHP